MWTAALLLAGFRFAQTAGLNQSWSDMVHIG